MRLTLCIIKKPCVITPLITKFTDFSTRSECSSYNLNPCTCSYVSSMPTHQYLIIFSDSLSYKSGPKRTYHLVYSAVWTTQLSQVALVSNRFYSIFNLLWFILIIHNNTYGQVECSNVLKRLEFETKNMLVFHPLISPILVILNPFSC